MFAWFKKLKNCLESLLCRMQCTQNKITRYIIYVKCSTEVSYVGVNKFKSVGFQQNMSTTHCTYVMMETISYYNANGSNVYALMLDARKAFDRVNYCKLFRVILKCKVSTLVLRLLLYMYTKQKLKVRWGYIVCHPSLPLVTESNRNSPFSYSLLHIHGWII